MNQHYFRFGLGLISILAQSYFRWKRGVDLDDGKDQLTGRCLMPCLRDIQTSPGAEQFTMWASKE